jgi:hypothetical protein
MNALKNRIAELEKIIINLRERLALVLRNDTLDSEKKSDKMSESSESLVPLAEDIKVCVSRVNRTRTDIAILLNELEL